MSLEKQSTDAALLMIRLREKIPELATLLKRVNDAWVYEDLVYRFYHGSFKVYWIQGYTSEIVEALKTLAPDVSLNPWFSEIVTQGTGHTFELAHNQDWLQRGRPMLEAFFHARFMLEMAVKHGEKLKDATEPPQWLDSGWAAFLCTYNLR